MMRTAALTGHGRFSRASVAITLTFAVALVLAVSSGAVAASANSDYPSWSDVQNARASESAKQAQIVELNALIVTLTADASARAVESGRQAGQLAAMLARTGSDDLSMTMFLDSANTSVAAPAITLNRS